MKLHENKELFKKIILLASSALKYDQTIIEKDYYQVVLLKDLFLNNDNFIFKGGTSLSKCFRIINRFSEDIDISVGMNMKSKKMKKENILKIEKTIDNCNLVLRNANELVDHHDINTFIIVYDSLFQYSIIKTPIKIEITYFGAAFPIEKKCINTYIYDYLNSVGNLEIIEKYDLKPFEVTTQTIERTFIDKVFAICDYYKRGKIDEHSRHIYDLYKIYPLVKFDEALNLLINNVREMRSKRELCISAHFGFNINDCLNEIIEKEIYKSDYLITGKLVYEDVSYKEAISVLTKIIEKNIF